MWCEICGEEITGDEPFTHFANYTEPQPSDLIAISLGGQRGGKHRYWHDACTRAEDEKARRASLNLKNFKLGGG